MALVQLKDAQRSRAANVLGSAFQNDPMYIAVLPDDKKRADVLVWLFDCVICYTLLYGEVYTTPNSEGVACWLPPGKTTPGMSGMMRAGLYAAPFKMGFAAYRRFDTYMKYADQFHKPYDSIPHWYLWAIRVDPSCQGQGVGSRIMQGVLSKIDGIPCYLETGLEINVRFYEKHGFKVVGHGTIRGVSVWGMLREGQTAPMTLRSR